MPHERTNPYITPHPDGFIVRISFPDSVKTMFFSVLSDAREFVLQNKSPKPYRFKRRAHRNSKTGIRGVFPEVRRRGSKEYLRYIALYKFNGAWKKRKFSHIEDAAKFRSRFEQTMT